MEDKPKGKRGRPVIPGQKMEVVQTLLSPEDIELVDEIAARFHLTRSEYCRMVLRSTLIHEVKRKKKMGDEWKPEVPKNVSVLIHVALKDQDQ